MKRGCLYIAVTTLLFSGTSDTVREGTTEPNTVTLL